jgi:hypothetical protein
MFKNQGNLNMKIEVVEFYPMQKPEKDWIGTMHIYIIDLDLDIRGIHVLQKKDRYIFRMPSKFSMENEKKQWFPVISFTNPKKNTLLFQELRKKGTEFMQNRSKTDKTQG